MARFWATPIRRLAPARRYLAAASRILSPSPAADEHAGPALLLPPPAPPGVFACTCGQNFNSNDALRAHLKIKAKRRPAGGLLVCAAPPARAQAWLWEHVVAERPIRRIERTAVPPSDTPVSSAAGSELVCSYTWRGRTGDKFWVPGAAAVWRSRRLPMALRQDRGLNIRDQNAARAPQAPFEPLFRATVSMNPSFRFDDVDLLVDRSSLCRLLDFSVGRRQESFRLHLHLVGRTLVVERCERLARGFISASADSPGWGKRFERKFTRYPYAWPDSASHHRALRYQFGDLSCVIRFEVDACYHGTGTKDDGPVPTGNLAAGNRRRKKGPVSQALMAEIKTASRNRHSMGHYLPQLWFGRTRWLIVGRHKQGTFDSVEITNMEAHFEDWETTHQESLRRTAAVLAQLRRAVEENGGEHCVAVCEEAVLPPAMRVFPSSVPRKAVSDDLRRKLWRVEASRPRVKCATFNRGIERQRRSGASPLVRLIKT